MPREGSWSLDDAVAQERRSSASPEPEVADETWSEGFVWTRGALELSIATGLILLAAVLALVANGAAWGSVSEQGVDVTLHLEEARVSFGGQAGGIDWNHQVMDDFEGIGQVRLAGTLFIVALISLFVGAAVVGASIAVRTANVTGLGGLLCGIALLVLVAATVLFPSGVETAWADGAQTLGLEGDVPEISWGGGLIMAWVAVGCVTLGIIGAFAAVRHPDVS